MTVKLAYIANRIEGLNRFVLLLVLNGLALGVFFFIGVRYNYLHPDNMGRLMFSTPDTKQYREIANWVLGETEGVPDSTRLRPWLYPLFLAGVRGITKTPYAFWAVQFCLWILAINLVSFTIYRFTKRKILLIIAFCIMALNVSAIVLTYFALTEILTIFLWALWLFVFANTNRGNPELDKLFLLTFLLSLLTVTKPIFQLHLGIFLVYILFRHARDCLLIATLALAVVPVVLQIITNLSLHGMFGVSDISALTVKWYLIPQVYAIRNSIPLDEARQIVAGYDTLQAIAYLTQNWGDSLSAFLQNLGENLTGASDYIDYYPKPYIFTRATNIAYLAVQIVLLPVIIFIFLTKKSPFALAIRLLYIFSLLVIFTSGISFNEGDRLVMTALPLWVVIYLSVPVLLFPTLQKNGPVA